MDISNIESLYSYAYSNKITFNNIYEQFSKEDCQKNEVVLFHGAKRPFSMPINFAQHSNSNNDFEDKLIVCDKNADFSKEEILKMVNFQEKYFKLKVILK